MKHGLRWSFVLALGLASAAGCDLRPEDFGQVESASKRFGDSWGHRAAELQDRHAQLFARAQAVPADAPGIGDVLSRLTAIKTDIEGMTATIDGARAEVAGKVTERRSRLAEEALARNHRDLETKADGISAALDEIGGALDTLEKDQAAKVVPPAPLAGLGDAAFAFVPGSTDVPGIAFVNGTAELDLRAPTTKPALDQLVAFAGRCDSLRFTMTGHTARDGDERVNARLSRAQADAVRVYLEGAGVAKEKIAGVAGAGGTTPLVAEPAAGSPEEKAMSTEELAAIRAQNRRLSVTVTTPCPTPS